MNTLKCPQCHRIDTITRFCGNCGHQLLTEGAEIEGDTSQLVQSNTISLVRKFLNLLVYSVIFICLLAVSFKLLVNGSYNLLFIFHDLIVYKKSYFFIAVFLTLLI